MTRFTLTGALVLSLLVLFAPRLAADDEAEETFVSIHDVADLLVEHPWLRSVLEESFSGAVMKIQFKRAFIVQADAETHDAIRRVLGWLRGVRNSKAKPKDLEAATRFRAELTRRRVTGSADEADLLTFLHLLREQQGLDIMMNLEVKKLLEGRTVTALHVEDMPFDQFLDMLAALVPMRWTVESYGIVRLLPIETTFVTQRAEVTLEFDDVTVVVDGEIETETQKTKDVDLREAVEALREEVRALRAEIRQIKELLEKRRAR